MTTPESGARKRRRGPRTGQSIIGFTEAELGLFLALLFFGLSQLGKTGVTPTVPRVRATLDSTSIRNPRLTQLLALARRLDSLDRAVRSAFARDSALAARLAQLQRERDSLRALSLGPIPGDVGGGIRAVSARPTVTPTLALSREISGRLTAVEREIALSQLTRSETSTALATVSGRADITRRQLDSIAPSVSQVIAPTRATNALYSVAAGAGMGAGAGAGGTNAASANAASSNAATANASPSSPGNPLLSASAAAAARLAAAALPLAVTPRDTMAVLRALAAAPVPPSAAAAALAAGSASGVPGSSGSSGSPGSPGSGGGDPSGLGGGISGAGASRVVGTGIGNGGGTGGGASGPGRSRQTPTCIELKVDTGSVAEVLIVAADRYTVRGRSGPLDTVLRVMQPDLASARRNQCRHNVRIRTAPQLAVDDYILALNALLPYFNTELARSSGSR